MSWKEILKYNKEPPFDSESGDLESNERRTLAREMRDDYEIEERNAELQEDLLQEKFNRIANKLQEGMKEGSITVKEAKRLYGKLIDLSDRSKSFKNYLERSEEGRELHDAVYQIYENNTPIKESY